MADKYKAKTDTTKEYNFFDEFKEKQEINNTLLQQQIETEAEQDSLEVDSLSKTPMYKREGIIPSDITNPATAIKAIEHIGEAKREKIITGHKTLSDVHNFIAKEKELYDEDKIAYNKLSEERERLHKEKDILYDMAYPRAWHVLFGAKDKKTEEMYHTALGSLEAINLQLDNLHYKWDAQRSGDMGIGGRAALGFHGFTPSRTESLMEAIDFFDDYKSNVDVWEKEYSDYIKSYNENVDSDILDYEPFEESIDDSLDLDMFQNDLQSWMGDGKDRTRGLHSNIEKDYPGRLGELTPFSPEYTGFKYPAYTSARDKALEGLDLLTYDERTERPEAGDDIPQFFQERSTWWADLESSKEIAKSLLKK